MAFISWASCFFLRDQSLPFHLYHFVRFCSGQWVWGGGRRDRGFLALFLLRMLANALCIVCMCGYSVQKGVHMWRPEVSLRHCASGATHHVFLIRISHCALQLSSSLGWPASEARELSYFHPPHTGITESHHPIQILAWVLLEAMLGSSCLCGKHFIIGSRFISVAVVKHPNQKPRREGTVYLANY